MIVYHVTTKNKLMKYLSNGAIKAPVRGWETISEAERFSKQTGRKIILRLKFPNNADKWPGHHNLARVVYNDYILHDM